MTTSYRVRDPHRDEIEHLVDLGAKMHQESGLKILDYNKQKAEAWLTQAFKYDKVFFFKVIEDYAGKAVGGMIAQASQTYYGHDYVVNDCILMLEEKHRHRCLPQLIEMAEMYKAWARHRGIKMAFLGSTTGIDSEHAERFFTALGFDKIGTVHAHRVNGV